MGKKILMMMIGLSFILGMMVPRRAEAFVVGLATSTVPAVWVGFALAVSGSWVLARGTMGGIGIIAVGVILGQDSQESSQIVPMDFQADLSEKVDQGLYTENEKQEILQDLAHVSARERGVFVHLEGLGHDQAVESIVQATGLGSAAAAYLVENYGIQN